MYFYVCIVQVLVQYSSTNLRQKEKKRQIRNPYTLLNFGFMGFGEERKKEKKREKKKGGFLLDNVMYLY